MRRIKNTKLYPRCMENYNMKKSLIICLALIGCNSISNRNVPKSNIEAECERIIIMDSTDYKTINFIVSFKNKSDDNIVLFTNSCYKKKKSDLYQNAGIMLKKENFITPIGIYIPKVILIPPREAKKYFFSFSQQYPNGWIKSSGTKTPRQELTSIAKNVSLFYKYDSTEMNKLFLIEEIRKLNLDGADISQNSRYRLCGFMVQIRMIVA